MHMKKNRTLHIIDTKTKPTIAIISNRDVLAPLKLKM